MGAEVEERRREEATDDQDERTGIGGTVNRSARITARATTPTSSVAQWMSPSVRAHDPSSRQALSPSDEVPVSFGSSPMTTSTAAPARNPVTTAFERNCAIQPSFERREEQEQHARHQRDRGDELCRLRRRRAR